MKTVYAFMSAFIGAKWRAHIGAKQLALHQRRRFSILVSRHLSKSPFYAPFQDMPLEKYPLINKQSHMESFDRINTCGLDRDGVLNAAIQSEKNRDFSPSYKRCAVGLSSGTSGSRGVFALSDTERAEWAGYIIGKMLPLRWGKHRVAFFFRANNNLYEGSKGVLVDFKYFDLIDGVDVHMLSLEAFNPTILIAPASVLVRISECTPDISPKKVISVAEVLDASDEEKLRQHFKQSIHQVYQCTEGFLASTCKHGNIHMNEDVVHIEKHWIDRESGRFSPIVTDLQRRTQPIVRYLLDDILIEEKKPCPCGSAFMRIKAIEGRADDVLSLATLDDGVKDIFPDFIRNTLIASTPCLKEYRVVQSAEDTLEISVTPYNASIQSSITEALGVLFARWNIKVPNYHFTELSLSCVWQKQRRVMRRIRG